MSNEQDDSADSPTVEGFDPAAGDQPGFRVPSELPV
jgi:hypothetical protein